MKLYLFIKVLFVHVAIIISIFSLFKLNSCTELKEENITRVKLVPLPNQKPEKDDHTTVVPASRPAAKKSPKQNHSYRSPETIRNTGFIKNNPRNKKQNEPKKTTVRNKIDISKIRNELKENFNEINHQNIQHNRGEIEPEYFQLVIDHLYQLWDQPGRSEIGNKHLEVKVEFQISRDGTIRDKKIITPSKIPAMDNSVIKLLRSIKKFPPFPGSLKKTMLTKVITLELT